LIDKSWTGTDVANDGWKVYGTYFTHSNTSCGNLNILGGVNRFGSGAHIYKTFSKLPPHQMLLIKFKLFKIDSWENENFCLSLDNKPATLCLKFNYLDTVELCGTPQTSKGLKSRE